MLKIALYLRFFIILLLLSGCGSKLKIEDRALRDGWMIASSKEVAGDAKILSENITLKPSEKWYKATLPTTVLGALLDAGEYKDVFVGKNLEKVPRARFENNWWFRNTFTVEDFDAQKEQLRLLVEGINYRANFWVNGKQSLKEGNRCFFRTIAIKASGYLFLNNSSAYSLKHSFFVAIDCLKKRESSS
jgi:exo-1,4-beta-D-glucosaminidase